MADDETKKAPEEESTLSKVGTVLGRMGEGLIDGIAKKEPIIGGVLQAGFNTEDYQARKAQQELAKQKLAEWNAEAGLRAKKRKNAEAAEDDYASLADVRKANQELVRSRTNFALENLPSEQEKIRAQTEADTAKNRLAASAADEQYKKLGMQALTEDFGKMLADNPVYNSMTYDERQALIQSPAIQKLLEGKFYYNRLTGIGKQNAADISYMDRTLARRGWSLVDGGDGKKYLDMGNGRRLAADRETIDRLSRDLSAAANRELNVRGILCDAMTLGDPRKRALAAFTMKLAPYMKNSAADAFESVRSVFTNAKEQELGWNLFHQAASDYSSSGLTTKEKLDGLAKCLPFLGKMGYKIEGLDPKNPDLNAVQFIEQKTGRRLSFGEFSKLSEENDTIGRKLDRQLGMAQWGAMNTAQRAKVEAAQTAAAAKAKKGKTTDTEAGEGDAEKNTAHNDLRSAFGASYASLPAQKQEVLQDGYQQFNALLNTKLRNAGKRAASDLTTEEIQALDEDWGRILDARSLDSKKFHSPVDSLLRQRRKEILAQEKQSAEHTAINSSELADDWENNYHGADDDDRSAAFRRNYRKVADQAHARRVKDRADKEIAQHDRVLKQRGRK